MVRRSFLIALACLCSLSFGVSALEIAPHAVTRVTLGHILSRDSDDTLAFTPHRDTVFFDRSEGKRKTIMVSHRLNGRWSEPRPSSFSGRWFDQDPVVA